MGTTQSGDDSLWGRHYEWHLLLGESSCERNFVNFWNHAEIEPQSELCAKK